MAILLCDDGDNAGDYENGDCDCDNDCDGDGNHGDDENGNDGDDDDFCFTVRLSNYSLLTANRSCLPVSSECRSNSCQFTSRRCWGISAGLSCEKRATNLAQPDKNM